MTERSNRSVQVGVALAAACALTAWWFNRKARQAEAAHPPTGGFVTVDGVRLHYIEQGSGEPVVLLHGNGALANDFAGSGLVADLARSYRVIAFDRPGFGYSENAGSLLHDPRRQAALLGRALQQLGVADPVLVGHSWGTLVALALALEGPVRPRKLVLLSGYYYPQPRLDALLMGAPALPLLGTLLRYTLSPLLSRLMLPGLTRKLFWPHKVPAAFERHVPAGLMLRPWQLKAAGQESAGLMTAAARLAPHYRHLQVPVVLLCGREDRVIDPDKHSLRLHRELPGSVLKALPGMGHMLHYIAPGEVAAAVRAETLG
ncbi:alpha/beta hydrolase [Chitiniphilus purpureus]|uniref:Alpha/beta hydrolase n=1 Tax=Chitiniphilus purpureus TaxID=2981137 RepID=A0ABY6DKD3_9NEIS|nr:alpha/beta hydrolase [Chitiniphilus sp. CD1]UXY14153.1 alpha/beta hydrolase [Chitiniphilus sp. CD1]